MTLSSILLIFFRYEIHLFIVFFRYLIQKQEFFTLCNYQFKTYSKSFITLNENNKHASYQRNINLHFKSIYVKICINLNFYLPLKQIISQFLSHLIYIIRIIIILINFVTSIYFISPKQTQMINILVDKAIERSTSKLQGHQPIFTISYSTIKPIQQSIKQQRSKTVTINKIPKIVKGSQIVFQKWKSKTIQKIKNIPIQTANLFSPLKNNKFSPSYNKNHDINNNTIQTRLSPTRKQRQGKIQYVPVIDDLKNLTLSPFIVHKKKLQTKSHSMYEKKEEKETNKSLYLQYREGLKNKTNKKVAFNKYYCQRRVSEGDTENVLTKAMINSSGNFQQETQQDERHQLQNKMAKNVSFINTIQYKTLPRQQIRPYKIDNSQKEKSRKTSLGHTENIFVRTKKQNNTKHLPELLNVTISAFNTNRQPPKEFQINHQNLRQQTLNDLKKRGTTSKISIRKVYTQKRTRKNFKDTQIGELREQQEFKKGDSYRPWSPVKTNPLFINDDDFIFQQSKTFNIQLERIGS